jgi:hypothetical protein
MEMAGEIQPGELCSPVIDLRQYTLFPGVRNEFVELFDRELVETQEAVGMRVIGRSGISAIPTGLSGSEAFRHAGAREP